MDAQGEAVARWQARPGAAFAVKAAIVALPLLFGVAAAGLMSWLVPRPAGGWLVPLWWLGALAASALAVGMAVRQLERLMPLVALLKLSLAFPDKTPSRARLALRAGSLRRLQDSRASLEGHGNGDVSQAVETVLVLAAALTTHDRRTRGHSERVRALSELIAEELHLPTRDREHLRWASLLHDCGKVTVDSRILNKQGPLNEEEWSIIRRHPEEGDRIALPLRSWLGDWSLAIGQHHERWDGSGYPLGLVGQEISLAARIVAVADSFDAMTATRSYQAPMSTAAGRSELTAAAGSQFDPAVVRAFLLVSTGRLHRALGPLSWLAQIPLAGSGMANAAAGSTRVAQGLLASVGGGAAVAAAVVLGVLGPTTATTPVRTAPRLAAPAAPRTIRVESATRPLAPSSSAPLPATTTAPLPPAPAAPPTSPAPRFPAIVPPASPSPASPPGPPVTEPPPATPLVRAEVRIPQAPLSASVTAVPGVCAEVVAGGAATFCS